LGIFEGGQWTRWITSHCTQEIPRGIMVGIKAICKACYGGAAGTLQREIQSIAIYLGCFLFCCAMRVEVINNNSPTMHWSLHFVTESLMVAQCI
jgi:hypothetical protein